MLPPLQPDISTKNYSIHKFMNNQTKYTRMRKTPFFAEKLLTT